MKTSSILALAVAGGVQLAAAHTTVWEAFVNGKGQGVGNKAGGYIDSPPNNNPLVDVTSKDMECNVASVKATSAITAAGGDEITFEWHHDNNQASDDIIATSHHGPILVYASKAGSALSWTKIAEDGWDGKSWAVDKLIAGSYTGTKGQHKVKLPNLAPGDYILRPEIIALHEGNRANGAQFYMECVHVKITGSGSAVLPAGVSIPGAYKANDAGVLFDIYGSFSSYPIPGPKLWDGASSGSAPAPAPAPTKAPAATAAPAPAPVSTKAPAATAAPAPAPPAKPTTLATVAKPAPTAGSGTVQRWGQCGGNGFTGATGCVAGTTCQAQNPYYSQCL
ncbi:carbohydrate-binding module family 1 protein [Cucurbitaria berberidis CBS 394.84]|uniref:AA9 family lytic polysaccharide monooxygenase n=1 Tax=Cucurbitaria berberidis CBS 394.84 TaxID=1168544 RepID=A0A9P4GE82_9PLEO|nr:carbohydrate-binding module family 1 protein [Cucurbitaria berberidis CBS 394.84]KAF1843886.1 carbohydrate-binding module family 1 protein [Cucurbitaria berberidis CBS 394.84]